MMRERGAGVATDAQVMVGGISTPVVKYMQFGITLTKPYLETKVVWRHCWRCSATLLSLVSRLTPAATNICS